MHTYINTYIHTYIHSCIHTYIHTYTLLTFDSACESFGTTIRNIFECGQFIVEYYGGVECGWRCSVG